MKPEKKELIHELLDGESRREITLLAGAQILRRRRYWRATSQAFALIALATVAGLLVEQKIQRQAPSQISRTETKPVASIKVQSLTDDELLALFPNTPVGLVTLPDGKKLLIFPRPGDEAKFVSHL